MNLKNISLIITAFVLAGLLHSPFAREAALAADAQNSTGTRASNADPVTLTRDELRVFQEYVTARVLSRSVPKKDAVNNCKPIFAACSAAAAMACVFECIPTEPAAVLLGIYHWSDSCNSCVDEVASQCIADSGC